MNNRRFITWIFLTTVTVASPFAVFAQSTKDGGWPEPVWTQDKKATPGPAPHHDISGLWGVAKGVDGVQAGGVTAMPNDGKPEHQLPFTPYGLKVYKSHKAVEGFDAVPPGDYNDPRELCEPLGFPRSNHYQVRLLQIYQDDAKVALLYQYDKRWRFLWTDGRALPTIVEGGVKTGETFHEPRFYGFSVGKWIDDTTLVVQTVGTMPEDRVWLDATGRPISDQLTVTETYHRVDADHLELSETLNDPKIYTKPWQTLNKLPLQLKNPRTDVMDFDCSPVEQQRYDKLTTAGADWKGSK